MPHLNVRSKTAHIDLGRFFYVGWDLRGHDGDEAFGLSVWDFYVGFYNGRGWCCGILDKNGCLPGQF